MLSDPHRAYVDGGSDMAVAARTHRFEVVEAVAAWKRAATDHAETSYWGALHCRSMRAYWLGVLRLQRRHGWGWATFHHGTES